MHASTRRRPDPPNSKKGIFGLAELYSSLRVGSEKVGPVIESL